MTRTLFRLFIIVGSMVPFGMVAAAVSDAVDYRIGTMAGFIIALAAGVVVFAIITVAAWRDSK